MNRPRYDILIFDKDNPDNNRYVTCESITWLGGQFTSQPMAQVYFDNGHSIAMGYDFRQQRRFYLFDITTD